MDAQLQMKVFVAVVDAGSFTGAAEALRMPKATVSRHVAALEARLGVRLLHRTTRRLSASEEGAVFHARCQELLAGIDEAEAEVAARAGDAVGPAADQRAGELRADHLAPLWPAFLAAHPRVTLDVTLSDRMVDLVDEGWGPGGADRAAARLHAGEPAPRVDAAGRLRGARVPALARRAGAFPTSSRATT
jgi:DNA-binding transcriptional LysR family regulator